jgi:glutamate-1-semialdehyde 2,1-aminomutase
VLTPQAYDHLGMLAGRLRATLETVITEYELDWHVVTVGAKGCVTFRRDAVREFRAFLGIDDRFGHLHWLMQHNGGVFLPAWGKVEQWLLSVRHNTDDVDRFAHQLRPAGRGGDAPTSRGPALGPVSSGAVR